MYRELETDSQEQRRCSEKRCNCITLAVLLIIAVTLSVILPIILIGVLAPEYVGSSAIMVTVDVIVGAIGTILWRVMVARQRRARNGTRPARMQLLPAAVGTNRPQREIIRDQKAEEEILIHISMPRRSCYAYGSLSTCTLDSAHSAECKAMSLCTIKKATASIQQKDEEKPIIGPVVEDDQGIKWWNEETSLK